MKKIVKGNDFTLKIPVMKMVEGQAKAFPLPACTDVVVQVCNQFKRIPLAFTIDVKEDNVLLAKVEGDKMSLGTYAIEVKGKIFGNDWRSNEYPQFAIVANNADADTEFIETDEGDNSVEMDTAMVILPPTVELSDLIDKANEVLKTNKETNDTLNANEESRKEAETLRDTAEQGRVSAEEARVSAEGSRTKAEEARVSAEAERMKAEKTRAYAEIKRKSDFDTAIKAAETATLGAERVNAELDGNVLKVTNRNGEVKSVNLTDTDEHVTVNCTTTMEGVSMEGLVINVYVNNGADPHQYTTDTNGQAEFTITKGATYKVVFPYVPKCNIIDPVQHVASVGNRIIDANYIAEIEKVERLTIKMSKADESGNATPWEGGKAYITISGKKTEYYGCRG